jgi:glycosyltransferase involved in cell wall biosynthesis
VKTFISNTTNKYNENSSKYRVLCIPADVHACGRERVVKPYTKIQQNYEGPIEFTIFDIYNQKEVAFQYLATFDAVLFQRPTHEMIPKVIGKKVVIEIDDLLDKVHMDNIAYKVFYPNSPACKNFFECLSLADAVHCSTPEIAQAYKLKNKNIHVFYNSIDFDDPVYKQKPKRETEGYPEGQVNIMWAGSSSHWDSMKLIRGIIEPVILRNDKAHLVICGNKQFYDIFNLPEDRKTYIQGVEDVNKFPIISSHGDIFLNPVVPSPFNEGKSELKILEAGIWSIPSVSSPVAPYTRFNELSGGANLIAKKNRPDSWQKQLQKLIEDEDLRKELGQKTYNTIKEHYNLDNINKQRIDFWHDLLL